VTAPALRAAQAGTDVSVVLSPYDRHRLTLAPRGSRYNAAPVAATLSTEEACAVAKALLTSVPGDDRAAVLRHFEALSR
jgi:hypothetical protein